MVLMVLRVMSSPTTKGKCSHDLSPMSTSTVSMLPSMSPFQGAIKVNFEQFTVGFFIYARQTWLLHKCAQYAHRDLSPSLLN
jgi:hypothetical protein